MTSFKELALSPALSRALDEMGYDHPTPIQAEAIPVALSNRDVVGCAQTGTGKTVAFCVPLLARLERKPGRAALILSPTREIAAQTMKVLGQLTVHLPQVRAALVIGGAPMPSQVRALGLKPAIIVATPGRLVDHLRRGSTSLSHVDALVLDEADRMLDMGFAPQLNEILRFLPKTRQTLLFSATLPPDILRLSARVLKDPVRVTVGRLSQPATGVAQSIVQAKVGTKNDVLLGELGVRSGSILIFARTKRRTDRLAHFLAKSGHDVSRIHGDRTQSQRNSALNGFRQGRVRILVATDVAARGIDIPHIAHVINYDLPQCADDYIHRIGRTARAGAGGKALSILTPEDRSQWREISVMLARTGSALS